MLRCLEWPDLADFEPYLASEMSLEELQAGGVVTEAVKKAKVRVRTASDGTTETEREVELFDRAGTDFDRVLDRTEGKPHQTLEVETSGTAPTVLTLRHGSRPTLPELSAR
jgi:hypothetical protein